MASGSMDRPACPSSLHVCAVPVAPVEGLPECCCLSCPPAVALQVLLGLTDAGYSGDWSRIGAITKGASKQLQQQHLLQACPPHGASPVLTLLLLCCRHRTPAAEAHAPRLGAARRDGLVGGKHSWQQGPQTSGRGCQGMRNIGREALLLCVWLPVGFQWDRQKSVCGSASLRGVVALLSRVQGVLFGALAVFEQLVLPAAAAAEGEGGEQGQQR